MSGKVGDGTRFFSSRVLARTDLEQVSSTQAGAVTILRFRVRTRTKHWSASSGGSYWR